MPQITERIKKEFSEELGVEPVAFDVDEAVAKGAAMVGEFAAIKNYVFKGLNTTSADGSNDEPVTITEEQISEFAAATGKTEEEILLAVNTSIKKVATKSYGIKAIKGGQEIIRNLIIKQSPVPASGTQVFKTACPNAEEIDLVVFANNESDENADLEMGEEIGQAVFTLPAHLPDRAPIEITFNLSDEGTLFMTAVDKTFNKKIDANFQAAGVMSEEELENARRQARNIVVD